MDLQFFRDRLLIMIDILSRQRPSCSKGGTGKIDQAVPYGPVGRPSGSNGGTGKIDQALPYGPVQRTSCSNGGTEKVDQAVPYGPVERTSGSNCGTGKIDQALPYGPVERTSGSNGGTEKVDQAVPYGPVERPSGSNGGTGKIDQDLPYGPVERPSDSNGGTRNFDQAKLYGPEERLSYSNGGTGNIDHVLTYGPVEMDDNTRRYFLESLKKMLLMVETAPKKAKSASDGHFFQNLNFSLCPTKHVQIFIPVKGEMTEKLSASIKSYIKIHTHFESTILYDSDEIKDNLPLIVVRQLTSRVYSDIDIVLDQIRDIEPIIVLIVHTCVESALPQLPSSSQLTDEKYKNIKCIDIAYTIEKGIYETPVNAKATNLVKKEMIYNEKQQNQEQPSHCSVS